jgi:hypothetical protein
VLNAAFLNNTAAQQRTMMALGPDRARQLEALLRAEKIVNRARTSLGNSTTARQLAEMGLAGGATAGAAGLLEQDFNPQHLLSAAIMGGVLHRGAQVIDQRVARRVGEMLASSDRAVVARGVQAAARNPVILNALRQATAGGARGAAEALNPGHDPLRLTVGPSPQNGFKHGGTVHSTKARKLPLSTRKESHYSPKRGTPDHHCGADKAWPVGACMHYRKPNRCALVAGFIAAHGGCSWYQKGGRVMPLHVPEGALATAKCHESNEDWPTLIEIVAYFGPAGRKGKRRSVEINADEFFGRGAHGAPMSGSQLITMIERLRRTEDAR